MPGNFRSEREDRRNVPSAGARIYDAPKRSVAAAAEAVEVEAAARVAAEAAARVVAVVAVVAAGAEVGARVAAVDKAVDRVRARE